MADTAAWKTRKLPTWLQITLGIVGGLIVLGILGSFLPDPPAETTAEKVTAAKPAAPPAPKANPKADAIAFFRKFAATVQPCDDASKQVSRVADAGDPVDLYRAAEAMDAACLSMGDDIGALKVPETLGKENVAAFDKAKTDCADAYSSRWYAADRMKKALDDGSISAQADLRDAADAAASGVTLCGFELVAVPIALGAKQGDLGLN